MNEQTVTEQILKTIEGGVMTLVFNRPDKKNAITAAMYAALADGLTSAETDPAVRVILIRSNGDAFTAGNDLSDFAKQGAAGAGAKAADAKPDGPSAVERFLRALADARKPIVAAVKGQAVGVGTTMLLHCDLVYVAQDAKLAVPFVNLALVPEAASSHLMVARLGHVRAFQFFGFGKPIDGVTAAAWGIANQAVPAGELDQTAAEAARALAKQPTGALIATKTLMRDPAALHAQMARESVVFKERLSSPEAMEAFRAFAEKRPPKFQ